MSAQPCCSRIPPKARELIADRGYDSRRCRNALTERGITPAFLHTRPQATSCRRLSLLPAAAPHRQRFRALEGLAPDRHPLRSTRPHRPVGHLHCGHRRLLAAMVSPEPERHRVRLTCLGDSICLLLPRTKPRIGLGGWRGFRQATRAIRPGIRLVGRCQHRDTTVPHVSGNRVECGCPPGISVQNELTFRNVPGVATAGCSSMRR